LAVLRWIAAALFYGLLGAILLVIAAIAGVVFFGLGFIELRDHRIGLGLGLWVAAGLAVIKGVMSALTASSPVKPSLMPPR
jgi:hypothetical protein